jgi:hypothetical protein
MKFAAFVAGLSALAVLAPTMSGAEGVLPVEGAYKGKTTQGQYVYFGVKEGAIVNPRYTVKWGSCGKSTQHLRSGRTEIDEAGHFVRDSGQTAIEGTFVTPTLVEGIALFREHPLAGCPEKAPRFKAHLR